MTHQIKSKLTQTMQLPASIVLALFLSVICSPTVLQVCAQTLPKAATPPQGGGPKENIKVHGHWTIEVRNPDGKLVKHHEFENALVTSGGQGINMILMRLMKPGEWRIILSNSTASQNPCISSGQASACFMYEPLSQAGAQSYNFKTLTIVNDASGYSVLSATATAGREGVINRVSTNLALCATDTSGVCDASNNYFSFSEAALASPVNVVAGQIIQVTVRFSFS